MAAEAREIQNAAEFLLIQRTEIRIGNMQKRKMVNLVLRVQYYLPVSALLHPVAAQQPLLFEWVAMNLLNHARHILSEGLRGIGTQVDENEPFPQIRGDGFQAQGSFVDVVKVGLV